jgi:protein-arginine kinase activator protein McsA
MIEEQIEQIAELIFQKMLSKQDEWDRQNGYIYITDGEEITEVDAILAEIDALNLAKDKHIANENYEKASEIQKKINKLRENLK